MRILLTNDDGINAPGLGVLERIAAEVGGPDAEIWVVAPVTERSGVGHCINYAHPTLIQQVGPRRFSVEGYPADCVLAGLYHVMEDAPPDLILSGVNRGNNSGENVVYSGTIGAAMEGALQDVKSIALSQFYGPALLDTGTPFEASEVFGARIVRDLLKSSNWESEGYQTFYNVNFPPVLAADVRGVRVAAQGWRTGTKHKVEPQASPSGRTFLWVTGGPQAVDTGPGTDVTANIDGYISVTPLRADLTARDHLDELGKTLDREFARS